MQKLYISFPLIIIYDLIIYAYIYIKSKCDLKKQYLTLISETIHLEEGESTRAWNIQKKTSRRKVIKWSLVHGWKGEIILGNGEGTNIQGLVETL